MSKKPKVLDQAVTQALANIRLVECRIEAIEYAIRGNQDRYQRRWPDHVHEAAGVVITQLYKDLNDRYRTLMMWGMLVDDYRHEVAKLVYQRFLEARDTSSKMSVAQYLTPDEKVPGKWCSETEDKLRTEIEAAAELMGLKTPKKETAKK